MNRRRDQSKRRTKVLLKCGHTVIRWDIHKKKTDEFYCPTCDKRVEKLRILQKGVPWNEYKHDS